MGAGLAELAVVDRVRVTIASRPQASRLPVDVFLLDLDLAEPTDAAVADTVAATLVPVVDSVTGDAEIAVGRRHVLGRSEATSTGMAEVLLTLAPAQPDANAVRTEAATAFRLVVGSLPVAAAAPLSRDAALSTARERVAEGFPEIRSTSLSVSAEDHHAGMWAIRLADASLAAFEVTIGFVDGHPATTHIRHLAASEVVDSVGSA